jgi:CHASE3 domain sensor protein
MSPVSSRGIIQVAAVLLLVAAAGVMAVVARVYWRDRNTYQRDYTEVVKSRDIVDTSRNAVSALQDAESQVQGYVLTAETSYSEAYNEDLRVWQDEFGTLELEAVHDAATPLVKDLSTSGGRVLDELAAVFSLRNEGSTAAALDRLRKGSALVYLEQARAIADKLREGSSNAANQTEQRLAMTAPARHRHLAEGAGALFVIALAEGLLLFLGMHARHGSVSESREKRNMATAV